MTILVDVLINVTELVRIEENARGNKYFEGLDRVLLANPKTIGMKNAVAAVLLMNADKAAAETMIVGKRTAGLSPA